MGLRRVVPGRNDAPRPDRQRIDDAVEAPTRKVDWPRLGDGRSYQPARSEFRPYLLHAQGRKRPTELRALSRRKSTQFSWALDRKSTRLNSSHSQISYAVFCLKKKKKVSGRAAMHTRSD